MEQTQEKVQFKLTPRQTLAFRHLTDEEDSAVLYGGAKGGGKSWLFCLWVLAQVRHLIQLFDLKYDPKHPQAPLAVGFIGRKIGSHFSATTLETFKRIIPKDIYQLKTEKGGGNFILFYGLVKVYYGGLDNVEKLEKFNSAEFAFIGIDQAEETERADVQVLQATLRLKYKGITPPYKELYTSNPADCWLKEDFIDNALPKHYYVPALPSDNPHLPASYTDRLMSIFKNSNALLQAYLFGNWQALKAHNALISTDMLNALKGVNRYPKEIRRCVVCDPSLGGDECVIYGMENGRVIETEILHNERDTMKIAGFMTVMGAKIRSKNYAADTTGGLGKGILDRVREVHKDDPQVQCFELNYSEASAYPERFDNLKAEMYWFAMEQIQDKKVPYPEDEECRNHLIAVRFKVTNSDGQIRMELKEETKKRIGRSPDRGDTIVMGWFIMPRCEPIRDDGWREEKEESDISSEVTSAMAA